ncbi:ABC transporter substrate-binding protein [Pusillimonas harenae]|uniref:ABC transporter substrate-binding protein n=2 Tax=Pollutimonas harenae TaxID=657015 RepID=A0A853GQG9_9BURK|nr:ABC transporter substrate-binding protein [Pollutimonas harenae]TEA73218.1 ABC transporter substrate-binding protein [Pollutimonas harenae]
MLNLSFIRPDTLNWQRLMAAALLAISALVLSVPAMAQNKVDPQAAPNDFVQAVADNALEEVKKNKSVQSGDLSSINQVIDEFVLPYVNFEKTTRLAAGRHWRQATPQQKQDLVQAFKGTLIRTYSGALSNVDQQSTIKMMPFRGDASADDVVVRSALTQSNGPAVNVDYRLEKTPQGWKIYDLNVENIWLIQNYRNQFAQQISQNGIDGLIAALNRSGK